MKIIDTLTNLISGIGTNRDKSSYSNFRNVRNLSNNEDELLSLYKTNWVAGKLVDIIPEDMTREWRKISGELSIDEVKKFEDYEHEINIKDCFREAHKWARLFGTAFIIIAVDDDKNPKNPLVLDDLMGGSLSFLKVVDKFRLFPIPESSSNNNNFRDNYELNHYQFAESSTLIHKSRVLRFDGVRLPHNDFVLNNYSSNSVLDRVYDSILNLETASSAGSSLLHEANIDVFKVKGLMQALATKEGTNALVKRFQLASLMKSSNNILAIDAEEDMSSKAKSFSGISEMLKTYSTIAAAACDIPATRLLSKPADGFNATGAGDEKNYYDMLKGKQESEYRKNLTYIDKILAKHLEINSRISFKFNPLFQMTPTEIALNQSQNAVRDTAYFDRGILSASVIAENLKNNGVYSLTKEYLDELKKNEEDDGDESD